MLVAKKDETHVEVVQVRVDARLGEFVAVISSVQGDVAELQMKRK